jgi:uncharacterized sulfatase
MGEHEAPPQPYLYGFRGRMDERYDMVRSVRDKRYIYIRNYMPHLIYGQHVQYMFQTLTTQVWRRLYDEGKLTPAQAAFWKTKPPEELYDLQSDPDEVSNLASSSVHQETLERLRKAQQDHALQTRDIGFLPEAEIHSRSQGSTPYELGHDDRKYPLKRIMAAAELAASLKTEALPELRKALGDEDSAVRYWAAMGILMRGNSAVEAARDELSKALADGSPSVRIVAAQALGQYGSEADLGKTLPVLVELARPDKSGIYASLQALNAVDALDARAAGAVEAIKALPVRDKSLSHRAGNGIPRLVEKILADSQRRRPTP